MPIKIIEDVSIEDFKQKADEFKDRVSNFNTVVSGLNTEKLTKPELEILSNEMYALCDKLDQLTFDLSTKAEIFAQEFKI